MSIVERPAPKPGPGAPSARSDRLRVITAGRVGYMSTRLGTSGFDIVAVAETEEDLVVAVSQDDPDAIVVEADLCDSLERVRDLAPDAVVIVVGDHTPAGADGRIERGVTGTVMAGLLHALVAEGVAGAVVWGLIPALRSPAPVGVPEQVSASLLSAKGELAGNGILAAIRDHGGLVATAGTIAVTASASLFLMLGPSHTRAPVERAAPERALERVLPTPTPAPSPAPQPPAHDPRTAQPGDRRGSAGPEASTDPAHDGGPTPGQGGQGTPPQGSTQPPATTGASRPPGVANGWDHRPPKKDDAGAHRGWSDNGVPDDHPPGKGKGKGGGAGKGKGKGP